MDQSHYCNSVLLSFSEFQDPTYQLTLSTYFSHALSWNDYREQGIGCNKPIPTTKEQKQNRIEVLRLLLVFMSRTLYISPGK